MRYTIHQLQIFLKVAEARSITKAAVDLNMTQPAVSIQLRNFQDQFDVPLTEVIGRQLYVTEFGKEIAEMGERVVQEMEMINYRTEDYKGVMTGRLSVSSASTGKYVIPFFLSQFMEDHEGVDLVLDVTNKTKVVESLKRNEIDFALVSVLPEDVEVEEEKLLENKLYLVGNSPNIDREKPLIYREPGSATRMAMEEYFKTHDKNSRKRMELTSNEAVKQAVVAGLGYSIMPLIGLKNELQNKDLHILPADELPMVTQWRIIWLKQKKLTPVARELLQYLKAEKEAIRKRFFKWYLEY